MSRVNPDHPPTIEARGNSLVNKWVYYIIEQTKKKDEWDSVVLNRRHPYNYKVFQDLPDGNRVSFNYLTPCKHSDAQARPYHRPVEFLSLSGIYQESIWCDPSINPNQEYQASLTEIRYAPFSWHVLDNAHTWHKIQPLHPCRLMMIEGPLYPRFSEDEKGWDKFQGMPRCDVADQLHDFRALLRAYVAFLKMSAGEI